MENGELQKMEEGRGEMHEIKAYRRRWLILGVFIVYASVNAMQWIEYSTITHIITKYYNVSSIAVDWTSIIYMVVCPVLVIPASYIIDKMGLRTAGLIGCVGTFLSTAIKVMFLNRDMFFIVMIGQFLAAASTMFIVCLPPKIAAVWFKANEVSLACSLGVFGGMFGNAMGFIIPPLLVKNSDNLDEIGDGIKVMSWGLTATMTPVAIAVLLYFPCEPPLPPSLAQAKVRNMKGDIKLSHFFKSVGQLFRTNGFTSHMVAYGLNVGVYSAIATLLSQFVHAKFQDNDELSGTLGFILVLCGMIGAVVFGIFLDRTHLYKELCVLCCTGATFATLGFMYALTWKSKPMCFVVCGILGVCTNAYMPVGFELAVELTYPAEESTAAGLMMAITQVLAFFLTMALGYLNMYLGFFNSLASQVVLFAASAIITCFVPNNKRRQEAYKNRTGNILRKPSVHDSNLPVI